VFLSYGATVVLVALNNRWPAGPTVVALISAIVPYATIPVELWVHRRGLLGRVARRRHPDVADARWYDRPLAWFLRRPWLLFVGILVAVVAIFAVLLLIGRRAAPRAECAGHDASRGDRRGEVTGRRPARHSASIAWTA
jgi:hypothetical protein